MNKFLFISIYFLMTLVAEARLYNYEDMPVGPRSFGMGNTGMAVSDDIGSVYYNPAVISWSEGNQISASVSSYSRIDTRTGKFVSLFKSATDNVTRGGFLSTPSTVGGFFKEDTWVWGGAVLVPNAFKSSGSLSINNVREANYESFAEDIWINAFASKTLNSRVSLGIGIFYVSRLSSEKFSFLDKSDNALTIEFREQMWDVNGATSIIGLSIQENNSFTWGLSFRSPVWQWGGLGKISNVKSGDNELNSQSFKAKGFPMPMRLSSGLLYKMSEMSALSADLHLYSGLKLNFHPDKIDIFDVDLKPIANLHLGYEYFFKESLGLRMGFYTNFSSSRKIKNHISAINDKVHMFGGTSSLVFASKSGEIALGGWVQGGQGYARSVDPLVTVEVPRSNYFYGGVIASSYRF